MVFGKLIKKLGKPSKEEQTSSMEKNPDKATSESPALAKVTKPAAKSRTKKSSVPSKPHTHGNRVKQPAWSLTDFEIPAVEGKTRFHDFDLPEALMHGIADLGFEYCSPIQAQSLPVVLKGNDLVGKAQTGTGKTAAFLIGIIDHLLKNPIEGERYAGEARALIIAPTRELVMQIADDARALTKYCELNVHTLVGGMDANKQKEKLYKSLVDILVATPGRLLDFMDSREIFIDEIECLVLDEADRMLDMGFIPQVRRIVRATPKKENRQTLLFSATFSDDVMNLVDQWTYKSLTIEIEPERVATDNVDQKVYLLTADQKFTLLFNLLQDEAVDNLIVFANRRDTTRKLYEKLKRHGVSCGILSGDVPQQKRISTLEKFKQDKLKVLVATDVAGRGIHIDGITHVVNYTLPEDPEDYVHRIGRTGRAGSKGTSISFACEDDSFMLPAIEKLLGSKLPCLQPPEALLKPLVR
ncbi:MAG: ATP-dependent RNA helicase RhlB [Pseudomonadales bacterium]|nr:ATP-dependent RNA helicase RhlB [Pseudomonadales bacterium]